MISTATLDHLVRTYGYWSLLVGTFFEGETILIIGGLAAQLGYLELPWVMVVAFIGGFSGDQLYFLIGRRRGEHLLSKHPKWQKQANKVHRLLERFHDLIMLGFRFVYGIRIMTPFVLGMNHRIKTGRFIVFNAIGAIIWSVVISSGGYFFGHALEQFIKDTKHYEIELISVILLVGLTIWLIHKYRENGRRK